MNLTVTKKLYPDSKVHGAYMGPTWGRQVPGGPHVGHMNLADRLTVCNMRCYSLMGDYYCLNMNLTVTKKLYTQIVRFMGLTWGLPGASRTHVGPMNLANRLTVCHVRCYLLKFAIHFVVHISSNIFVLLYPNSTRPSLLTMIYGIILLIYFIQNSWVNNSLALERCVNNATSVFYKLTLQIYILSTSCKNSSELSIT